MGMYNEVHKSCLNCHDRMTIQIRQIELGFGNYNLDNPNSYSHLTTEQQKELMEAISKETFYCYECRYNSSRHKVNCPDCGADLEITNTMNLKFIRHNV